MASRQTVQLSVLLTRFLARLSPHAQEECGVLQENGLDYASYGACSSCLSAKTDMFEYIEESRIIWLIG
jgi:hypothetical protein